jgi:hypothetical protein
MTIKTGAGQIQLQLPGVKPKNKTTTTKNTAINEIPDEVNIADSIRQST